MKSLIIAFVSIFFGTISLFAQNPRLLMVVPPDLYHDTEFSDPMIAFNASKIDVVIASTKTGIIKGVIKDSIQASLLLSDVDVAKFDAICIMGGKGTGQYLWENQEVANLIVAFQKEGKLVTGICAGAVSLAKAGVLKDKTATTFPAKGFINQLETAGARYTTDSVAIDGMIITANGPIGAKSFGVEIAKALTIH